jgi:hypothetical protein
MDLTEHCISSEIMAQGDLLTVKRDAVRLPNGNTSHREYVMHPGAVVVVPILANGNVVLERQFRYPLHQVFIELPAGKIDANEDILKPVSVNCWKKPVIAQTSGSNLARCIPVLVTPMKSFTFIWRKI